MQITRIAFMIEQFPHLKGVEKFNENKFYGRYEKSVIFLLL
jgi:hypothetical protein